jgi:predicted ArsR family transcriptional regulator
MLPKLTPVQEFCVTPQTRLLYDHIRQTGGISAREAMDDYNITSATLARRMCDLEQIGLVVIRETKKHPISGRRYTRYAVRADT